MSKLPINQSVDRANNISDDMRNIYLSISIFYLFTIDQSIKYNSFISNILSINYILFILIYISLLFLFLSLLFCSFLFIFCLNNTNIFMVSLFYSH